MIVVMNFKIIDTIFTFENQNLWVNDEAIELKQATLKTLKLFLESKGIIISKDDFLDQVWENVIVSDSSVFKQIELVRKLFKKAGLPQDTIENIYAKGYKIKYEISQTTDGPVPHIDNTSIKTNQFSINKYAAVLLFVALITVTILYFSGYFENKLKTNYLSESKRKSMIALMNNDWKEGLNDIITTIDQEKKHLSKDDQAFLYSKKGRAQYHLQEYNKSLKAYSYALKLYQQLEDKIHAGQVHLNMATSLSLLPQVNDSYDSQLKHIDTAISLFQQSDDPIKMIDAQMVLAHLYQKYNKIDKAITLFEKTIIDANNIKDTTGAMIANNNLASAHLIINHYDKAIELGQIGLDMALKIGKGRYIASSYSFLSDLYQSQYRSTEAMNMIQQAIKHQLSNHEFSNIGPKLITLSYLLVQTYQHNKAEELLNLAQEYAQSLKMNNGVSIISLYKGLNAARQNNWKEAEGHLKQALKISQKINFKYKQPLNKAYLSLAYYFNQNNLQAIEKATEVINDSQSDDQSKAIAALSLAYSYAFIEKKELADQWFQQVQILQNPKWLFEYQLYLTLKLERQNDSIFAVQTQKEIQEVQTQMLDLAQSAKVDEAVYQNLLTQISEKVQTNIIPES